MHLLIQCQADHITEMYKKHKQAHPGDAGFDLYCVEEVTVEPGQTVPVNLGIKISAFRAKEDAAIQEGTGNGLSSIAYWITPRSSISKTPLRLANSVGLIDAGYRGNLMGLFDNIKDYPYTIHKGDRLLQAVAPDLSEITFELVDTLDQTQRGDGGIGSTGA